MTFHFFFFSIIVESQKRHTLTQIENKKTEDKKQNNCQWSLEGSPKGQIKKQETIVPCPCIV